MNWTKIPTDLLKQRIPDNEILAIVKYQMLWADLEYQPDDETALRYITNKQLMIVKRWLNTIEAHITSDIKAVNKNRNKRRISYRKNNGLSENVTGTVTGSVPSSVSGSVEEVDKIRLDKIRLDKKENNKKKKENNPECELIVERLKSILEKHYDREFYTRGWGQYVQKMITIDKIKPDSILSCLDWYSEHIGEKYTPVIQSTSSLREKYGKLEAAKIRSFEDRDRSYEVIAELENNGGFYEIL